MKKPRLKRSKCWPEYIVSEAVSWVFLKLKCVFYFGLGPVVQRTDNAIQQMYSFPAYKSYQNLQCYPLDSVIYPLNNWGWLDISTNDISDQYKGERGIR